MNVFTCFGNPPDALNLIIIIVINIERGKKNTRTNEEDVNFCPMFSENDSCRITWFTMWKLVTKSYLEYFTYLKLNKVHLKIVISEIDRIIPHYQCLILKKQCQIIQMSPFCNIRNRCGKKMLQLPNLYEKALQNDTK